MSKIYMPHLFVGYKARKSTWRQQDIMHESTIPEKLRIYLPASQQIIMWCYHHQVEQPPKDGGTVPQPGRPLLRVCLSTLRPMFVSPRFSPCLWCLWYHRHVCVCGVCMGTCSSSHTFTHVCWCNFFYSTPFSSSKRMVLSLLCPLWTLVI